MLAPMSEEAHVEAPLDLRGSPLTSGPLSSLDRSTLRERALEALRSAIVDFETALGHRQEAYERLLEDAMDGRRHRFAREDTIDEEWRIVEPILDLPQRPVPYYRGTWGPAEAERLT